MQHALFYPIKKYLVSFLLFFIIFNSYSQPPILTQPINSAGTTFLGVGSSTETGNDVWEDSHGELSVIVNSNGIYWDFTGLALGFGSNTGFLTFPSSDVISPDVSIVVDGFGSPSYDIEYYVLVVYYDPSNGYYDMRTYWIDKSTGTLSDITVLSGGLYTPSLAPDAHENAIRIDANLLGDFVIIWEEPDPSIQELFTWAGFTLNGTGPTALGGIGPELSRNGYAAIPGTFQTYMQGDVALKAYEHQLSTVFYSYLDVDASMVFVDTVNYADVYDITFTSLNNILVSAPSGSINQYGRPRIACSGDVNFGENFTVVWEYDQGGFSDIVGISDYLGTYYNHVYTDNSEIVQAVAGFAAPQSTWHELPSVSYGNDGNHVGKLVEVSWLGGWSDPYFSNQGTDDFPTVISLSLDAGGFMWSCNIMTPQLFRVVSDLGISSQYYDTRSPSVAGKHAFNNLNMNIAWQDDAQNDVFFKDFNWCDATFRTGQISQNNEIQKFRNEEKQADNKLYPNPSSGNVTLSLPGLKKEKSYQLVITDILGRIVITFTGNTRKIESIGSNAIGKLGTGMYILNLYDKNMKVFTTKIIRL